MARRNNAKQLMKNLAETFGPAIVKTTKPIIISYSEIMRDDAKGRAPVKTGKLRDSIKAKYSDKGNYSVLTANATAKDGTRYGFVLEYTGHPFFYPAVDAHRDAFKSDIIRAIDKTCRDTNKKR